MSLGLCVSPEATPGADVIAELNPPRLRSILRTDWHLDRLVDLGRQLTITINTEYDRVGSDWAGLEQACEEIANRGQGLVVRCPIGNEGDIWGQSAKMMADLVERARSVLQPAGILVGTTSVASEAWVAYLRRMLASCYPDFADFHPYGWAREGLSAKLLSAQAVCGDVPIYCSEVGVHLHDAGGEEEQADLLRRAASVLEAWGVEGDWFAWHDAVGAPGERGEFAFGLMAEDGRKRPAWYAYRDLYTGVEHPTPPPPSTSDSFVIGDGLRSKLRELGWTPQSNEHVTDAPLVWAQTDDGVDGVIFWDKANGTAVPYRRA